MYTDKSLLLLSRIARDKPVCTKRDSLGLCRARCQLAVPPFASTSGAAGDDSLVSLPVMTSPFNYKPTAIKKTPLNGLERLQVKGFLEMCWRAKTTITNERIMPSVTSVSRLFPFYFLFLETLSDINITEVKCFSNHDGSY